MRDIFYLPNLIIVLVFGVLMGFALYQCRIPVVVKIPPVPLPKVPHVSAKPALPQENLAENVSSRHTLAEFQKLHGYPAFAKAQGEFVRSIRPFAPNFAEDAIDDTLDALRRQMRDEYYNGPMTSQASARP